MKTRTIPRASAFLAVLLPILIHQPTTAQAQGTAFTYQGQLVNNGMPANGLYDFDFKLWDTNNAPIFQVGDVVKLGVGVTNGLFTTTLDFGAVFDRYPTLLDVYVRTNGSPSFTQLSPMQALTPVPYALSAASVPAANLSGTVALGQLPAAVLTNGASGVNVSGTFAGNGAGLAGVALLAGGNTFTGNQAINNGSLSVNGKVGVGTTTPQQALDVNGNISVSGGINAGGDITDAGQIGAVGSLAALSFQCRTNPNVTWQWRDNGAGADFGAFGENMLFITQSGNVGIGTPTPQQALDVNGSINANGAIGANAISLRQAQALTVNGASGLFMDGNQNSYVAGAGNPSTTGAGNTAIGSGALPKVTTGANNTAIGISTLTLNTNANNNTAVGKSALQFAVGGGNTALGSGAGQFLTTGTNNIFLGCQAGSATSQADNDIAIGGSPGTTANTIAIGSQGLQTKTSIAGIFGATVPGAPVYVNDFGQLGTLTSSARFKQDIRSMDDASEKLLALRPVTFQYKPELDARGIPQFGLVAEEVDQVDPDLVVRDDQNQIYTVRYEAVNAMLLNEFLKEHRRVAAQAEQIQELRQRLDALAQAVKPASNAGENAAR